MGCNLSAQTSYHNEGFRSLTQGIIQTACHGILTASRTESTVLIRALEKKIGRRKRRRNIRRRQRKRGYKNWF